MGFASKKYVGGIWDEEYAARIYDKYAILSQGKTWFNFRTQRKNEF